MSPASKHLLSLQKELRDATDLHRKLSLLVQYRQNGEYSKIDGLIDKWTGVAREAIGLLWREAGDRGTGLDYEKFLAALQLGKRAESLILDENGEGSDDGNGSDEYLDDSVIDCLCQADN
jgi:hypothetical protein